MKQYYELVSKDGNKSDLMPTTGVRETITRQILDDGSAGVVSDGELENSPPLHTREYRLRGSYIVYVYEEF
jgi:hypothetical protein